MNDESQRTLRVLVFGATGVGKTSVCNVLSGRNRPTSNGPLGVTEKTHIYAPFEYDGVRVQLIDTAGLHESSGGTVPPDEAVMQIVELLKSSRDGFNLLLHVARASRLTKEQEEDHEFFVRKMTEGRVPTLLVLTNCENEDPMHAWVERNRAAFAKFGYAELVPGCFASGGKLEEHYASLRASSREDLLKHVVERALPQAYLLYGGGTGRTIMDALFDIWNKFVDLASLPKEFRRKTNEGAVQLLRRLGVSEKVAEMAAKHLPDVFEEVAGKIPVPGSGKVAKWISTLLIRALQK